MVEQEVAYMIGATISGDNGPCGTIGRVVIDPINEAVTHVVANSPHQHGSPRLVPVTLLSPYCESADGLQFHGTIADFYRLTIAEETHLMSPPPGFRDDDQAMLRPYFAEQDANPGVGGAVRRKGDGVHLNLSRQQVKDLATTVNQPAA